MTPRPSGACRGLGRTAPHKRGKHAPLAAPSGGEHGHIK